MKLKNLFNKRKESKEDNKLETPVINKQTNHENPADNELTSTHEVIFDRNTLPKEIRAKNIAIHNWLCIDGEFVIKGKPLCCLKIQCILQQYFQHTMVLFKYLKKKVIF